MNWLEKKLGWPKKYQDEFELWLEEQAELEKSQGKIPIPYTGFYTGPLSAILNTISNYLRESKPFTMTVEPGDNPGEFRFKHNTLAELDALKAPSEK